MEKKIIENVRETIKYGEYRRMQLMDAGLGLCGETSEVCIEFVDGDKEKIKTELGDVLWYIYSLADGLNILEYVPSLQSIENTCVDGDLQKNYTRDTIIIYVLTKSCEIADIIKKFSMKGIDIDANDMLTRIKHLMVMYTLIAIKSDLNIQTIVSALLDKLQSRYPDGVAGGEVR